MAEREIQYLSTEGEWLPLHPGTHPLIEDALHLLLGAATWFPSTNEARVSWNGSEYRLKLEPVEITASLTKEEWGLLLEDIYTDEARELRWRLRPQLGLEF